MNYGNEKGRKLTKTIPNCKAFAGDPRIEVGAYVPTRIIADGVHSGHASLPEAKPKNNKPYENLTHH